MAFADPRVQIKSSSTFRRNKCPLLYQNLRKALKAELEKDLKDVNGVGLTTDGWTSRNNDPYQSLTLHYINKDFNLKR
jgi:hypothetical protein